MITRSADARSASTGLTTFKNILPTTARVHGSVHSLCPVCRAVIGAEIFDRDERVYLRKLCPDHGPFEALLFGDAALFQDIARYRKPGQLPLAFSTTENLGCPYDCGICPKHEQHLCLAIIEVNSACNLDCPLCLANSGTHLAESGFQLTRTQVESMLDKLFATERNPEVLQFSGGEPTLHPQILDFIRLAQDRGISYVVLNTNGIRIARDDRFAAELGRLKPHIYMQFDGFDEATYRMLRGRDDLLKVKLEALDRLAELDVRAILVATVEREVNEHEIGAIVGFGLRHPAVFGVSFQSAFHAQRYPAADPLMRVTTPDILKALEAQTHGLFRLSDFIPVPCCVPTCGFSTYALLTQEAVIPLPRVLEVDQYLDYIANRTMPKLEMDLLLALEALWSASATASPPETAANASRSERPAILGTPRASPAGAAAARRRRCAAWSGSSRPMAASHATGWWRTLHRWIRSAPSDGTSWTVPCS